MFRVAEWIYTLAHVELPKTLLLQERRPHTNIVHPQKGILLLAVAQVGLEDMMLREIGRLLCDYTVSPGRNQTHRKMVGARTGGGGGGVSV